MNEDAIRTESWPTCPAGALQAVGQRARARRRLHGVMRAAGAAAVVLCLAGLTVWSVGRSSGGREYYFGGIACHDVRAHLAAFARGTLSDELAERIATHLKECPACRELMQQMHQQQVSTVSRQAASCRCSRCRALVADGLKAGSEATVPPHIIERVQLALAASP